ncbi:hypothetical protein ACSBR1_019584 [Camellia fascicularis]
MDPCPFMRIVIGGLAVKLPVASKPTFSGVHPSSSPCFCKIKLKNIPSQIAISFNLNKTQFDKLVQKPRCLKIEIYKGRRGNTCGLSSGKLLGTVFVALDVKSCVVESRTCVVKNGWVLIEEEAKGSQLHLNVVWW